MPTKVSNARLAFPDLHEAKAFEEGGKKQFGATLLIAKDSPSVKVIEAAIEEVAKAKWPGGKHTAILASIKGNPNKYCLTDGDLKDKWDGFAGNYALSAKRDEKNGRPTVVDVNPKIILQASDGKPYPGCYVNAFVEIWAQDNKFGKGIRATLTGVQFLKDGDAFSATRPADANDFDDLSAQDDDGGSVV